MSLNQLSNCPKCGKLFVKGIRDVCPDCFKLEEAEYTKVITYLRDPENRDATIYETSEATEVSVKQITKFIRQGRISLKNFPKMGYPCESCGHLTMEGNLCLDCRKKFTSSVSKLKSEIERQEIGREEMEEGYFHVKYSRSKRKGE